MTHNLTVQSIARRGLGVEADLVKFIHRILCGRTIAAEWGGACIQRGVSRGTPQGGVLSPLLWNIVLNDLLGELEGRGCRVIAYADDVAIVVRGKFLSTLYDLIQSHLNLVAKWSENKGLAVNSSKTELVLFTRRYKVPSATLPTVGGIPLTLSDKVKYLGLILDRKLSWLPNTEERARKAAVALYSCRGAIGKRWGLSPKVISWMYEAIVKPIMLYGVLVWWNALERTTVVRQLERVQRAALIGISGALRTTPTLALNVMLNKAPVDIAGRVAAARAAVRLMSTGCFTNSGSGHATVLGGFDFVPACTDHCVPYLAPRCSLLTLIPQREGWTEGSEWSEGPVNFYTDGSKLNGRVGGGVFCRELSINLSFGLPDHCSVFQAEVSAIKEAVEWLHLSALSVRDINIYSDSQAAVRALGSQMVRSRLVGDCLSSLSAASYFRIKLIWVPGHSDVAGNCMADELARKGTLEMISPSKEALGMPLTTCGLLLDNWASCQLGKRWAKTTTCATARSFWPSLDRGRSGELLRLTKPKLSVLVGLLTGHCPIGIHAVRLNITSNPYCCSCLEDEVESSKHFLLSCPAFARLRAKYLGSHFFNGPEELSGIDISRLLKFLSSTQRFD